MLLLRFTAFCLLVLVLWCHPTLGQEDFDQIEIETIRVAQGVYMLVGAGGNIGVSAGEDGVFLIDDQYAPLTEKVKRAIAAISSKPIRFVLNTHWHWDHTGGNENLGQAGVLIVAHDNVRVRMSIEQFVEAFNRTVLPSPEAALPVVTFSDSVTFHLNGDEIHAFHVVPAHTDTDSVVHFRNSNVVHTGDLFNRGYPFIDLSSGGSLDGMIEAVDRVLQMINSDTRVIPGHGPLGDHQTLQDFHRMLVTVRDRVKRMMDAGKTVERIVLAELTAEFDEQWGQRSRKGPDFVRQVYNCLQQN